MSEFLLAIPKWSIFDFNFFIFMRTLFLHNRVVWLQLGHRNVWSTPATSQKCYLWAFIICLLFNFHSVNVNTAIKVGRWGLLRSELQSRRGGGEYKLLLWGRKTGAETNTGDIKWMVGHGGNEPLWSPI